MTEVVSSILIALRESNQGQGECSHSLAAAPRGAPAADCSKWSCEGLLGSNSRPPFGDDSEAPPGARSQGLRAREPDGQSAMMGFKPGSIDH